MEAVHALLRQSKGLASLRLQNHIYGCFLVMEDIASRALTWNNGTLQGSDFALQFERDFEWIGVRYGFMMDRGLTLVDVDAAYRAAWYARFAEIGALEGGEAQAVVDATEDALLVTIRSLEEPFFVRALDTGALPQPMIERALRLLMEPAPSQEVVQAAVQPAVQPAVQAAVQAEEAPPSPIADTRLTHATAEKPIRQRILAHTIRHKKEEPQRVRFQFTRRAHAVRK